MDTQLRNSGIDVVGGMPWGTHFCHFYETKEDLLETLVPYFKAGLKSGEFCLWVVSNVTKQEALNALRRAIPDFERHVDNKNIEVLLDRDWYLDGETLEIERVTRGWNEKLSEALNRGYPGMRVAGGTCFLPGIERSDFTAYEEKVNEFITNRSMTCLCSFPVATTGAAEVLDVVRTHQFSVARRSGTWEVLETPENRQAKSEIKRLNDALERRVIERTTELTAVNEQLRRALEEVTKLRQRLESENAYLREEAKEASGSPVMGRSPGIRHVLEQADMVAPTDAAVLILGETGVGKELVARAIHEGSPRCAGPLIKVNCTAIPRELFESEFFGHVKGAFSGALKDRMGRFQLADGGTLFLDEVGDLPPQMQPKLLRVLEESEFEPVGDDRTRRANVRVIAATNHDLNDMVLAGRFREDLYYRLSVFPIEVPPLRERKEDIPLLAAHFLEQACMRFNRPSLSLSESHIQQFQNYSWPGNVRELRNVVERAVISARGGSLRFSLLDIAEAGASPQANPVPQTNNLGLISDVEMKRYERQNIEAALNLANGRVYGHGGAAELLGIKPTTLSTRIKKLGLKIG
jgi:transcriptional regulator with GAF, ATPase, and Fis domain